MTSETSRKLEACEELRRDLAEIATSDEQGLIEYLPLAARLAALGENGPLQDWRQMVRPFGKAFERVIVERCREGTWDLRNALGEDLALAVVDAQDFYCFLRREGAVIGQEARRALEAWALEADDALLDEDAAAVLHVFVQRFPVPEEDRLAVIDSPITETEQAGLAMLARSRETVERRWPAKRRVRKPRVDDFAPEEEQSLAFLTAGMAHFDASAPSHQLQAHVERLECPFDVPGIGPLHVTRQLTDKWAMLIIVERPDGGELDVECVRVGVLPAGPQRDGDRRRWLLDLMQLPHDDRVERVHKEVSIRFRGGLRLCLG